MFRNLFLNIMKSQDSLHGSEQTQVSSALLGRMMFVHEKQKFLLLRIQELCDNTNISTPLGEETKHFFWRPFQ